MSDFDDPAVSEKDMQSPLQDILESIETCMGRDWRPEEDHSPNAFLSDGKRQQIEAATGVTNLELQDKIFKLLVEETRASCHYIIDQMTSRVKQGILIERDRMASYIEEQALLLEAKAVHTIPIRFVRHIAAEVKLAKHHRSRSGNQYVMMDERITPAPTEQPVNNRLVIEE